jgi:hypothetical protein
MTQERVESEGFYEMLWDCEHCGTKRLLAKSQRYCAECGAPQNPDKRYYPPPDQEQRVEGHAYEGGDRTCPSCQSPMGAKAKNCTHCGSPLDGARDVKSVDDKLPAPPKKKRRWPWILAIVLLVVGATTGFLIWYFTRTKNVKLEIVGHRWQRTIAIVEMRDHEVRAWRDQPPMHATGFAMACRQEQRSSRQVQDGEECHTVKKDKKDGTFEKQNICKPKYRSEPIYDEKCSFMVRDWVPAGELVAKDKGMSPVWPPTDIPLDAPMVLNAKKQGARTTKYILDLKMQDGTDECSFDEDAKWKSYKDGQKLEVKVRARDSTSVVCDSL